jgi:hypothetical protein
MQMSFPRYSGKPCIAQSRALSAVNYLSGVSRDALALWLRRSKAHPAISAPLTRFACPVLEGRVTESGMDFLRNRKK